MRRTFGRSFGGGGKGFGTKGALGDVLSFVSSSSARSTGFQNNDLLNSARERVNCSGRLSLGFLSPNVVMS